MRPTFYPSLINDAYNDPGLYIQFLLEEYEIFQELKHAPKKNKEGQKEENPIVK